MTKSISPVFSCQKQVEDNVHDLVGKMVETEQEDMCAVQPPEVDINDQYYTTVGITLFQMVDQNVSHQTGQPCRLLGSKSASLLVDFCSLSAGQVQQTQGTVLVVGKV